MTKILAADPGVTTGVVIVEDEHYSFWEIDCRSLVDWFQFLSDVNPDFILYEEFKHRPNLMKAELYSKEVIGVTRLYAEANGIPIEFTPMPTQAKAFWSNAKIELIGYWKPGKKHAMDALRVFLTWKQKTDVAWFGRMLEYFK